MKNKGYIYKITNKINGKSYIGQTRKTIEKRFNEHFSDRYRKMKSPLHRAFNKYGIKSFELSLICECDVSELNDKEIEYHLILGRALLLIEKHMDIFLNQIIIRKNI